MEAAGIPTVAVTNLRERVEWVRYPRAVVVRFPRGATVGPPEAAFLQRQVLQDAFTLLENAPQTNAIFELPHRWKVEETPAPADPGNPVTGVRP